MKAQKLLQVTLGILTSIGGFLDVGAIATAAEAGASFGFQLLWAIVLGTICVIVLVEMSGRLAAVSKHTLVDAVRERLGFTFYILPFIAEIATDFLVLAAEIGGVCIALQLVTGISFQWWAFPVAFAAWLLVWKGNFDAIEDGTSLLGLVTLVFVVATFKLHPNLSQLGVGLLPTLPRHDTAHYLFIAVGILGALISPYLFYFYSSGAVENHWTEKDLGINRIVAGIGMSFGSLVSLGVLIVSALVLGPRGIEVDRYEQVALVLTAPFGIWGFYLFAASLAITCFGAIVEVTLDIGYVTAQSFGWNWGENLRPKDAARFSTLYTVFLFASATLIAIGIDPLKLTLFTMAITAAILPLVVFPFLILLNDESYVGQHRNGWFSNALVIGVIGVSFILAIIAIPLEIYVEVFGG
ncbi:Nramp family divalent metal transporter [Scytonema sp. NUACC26]|uniref:Nramp family divalent metal transporter n=1 Tax=Scytonema sp. NUACC26 TaxID=3140176 RepID=UPI0034DC8901